MKHLLFILACGMCFQTGAAQGLPKWANKARKAVFSVITYGKDNQILNTGNGFYIGEDGTAVSDYTLFKGAERAVVVTADGKELPVTCIMGANDIYDVVKFKTQADKKTAALQPAPQAAAQGATVYLLPYSTQKAAAGQHGTVTKTDSIGKGSFYYTLDMQTTPKTVSCPLMDAEGRVLGLIQKSADGEGKESYAIGIGYASALSISALSAGDLTLRSIGIRKALPDDEAQALVYLYMASSQMQPKDYLALLDDFIARYPESTEGYLRRAAYYLNSEEENHGDLAAKDLERMEKVAAKKDEAHYNIAKLAYTYRLNLGGKPGLEGWTYERALAEIDEALALAQEPIYQQVKGDILFAMQRYAEASDAYCQVNKTALASASTFYAAAKAKELAGGADKREVLALMDSAVARFDKPYGQEASAYLYERARVKDELEDHRGAVIDYNDFHDAMRGQVSAEFYFIREQAEMECRMYQQAINDINKAVEMEPGNAGYWTEKGSVHLRVNQPQEAADALRRAISLDPRHAPAYRMLGYCQMQQKQPQEGMANLQKAKELGDEVAASLLQKYAKP